MVTQFLLCMRQQRAAALVEFALLAPILVTLLFGMVAFGQHLLVSHTLQQIANDAARASVAGITAAERRAIVTANIERGLVAMEVSRPASVSSTIVEATGHVTVTLSADVRELSLFRLAFLPLPDPIIRRHGMAMLGGVQ